MKISHYRFDDKNEFLIKKFRQLLWGTLLLSSLFMINIFIGAGGEITRPVVILGAMICSILLAFYLIKIDKEDTARAIVLWSVTLSVTYISWLSGGLRDSSVVAYPILIVFSALLGGYKVFLSILVYIIAVVLYLGITTINGTAAHPLPPLGYEQVFDVVMLTLLSAYVAWSVSSDMNTTLGQLNDENQKVIKSRETIQLMVERDALTGLLNQPACESHFTNAINNQKSDDERIILFFLDLDNFKNVNDSFGHNAGDELLIGISDELSQLLRPCDVACRLGGDEFVLIIKRDDKFDIDYYAEEVLKVITTPYHIGNTTVRMTGSVGIAVTPENGTDFDDIRKKADIAMYKSKQSGKNTFSYYSETLHEETLRKTSILNDLKDAIEHNLLDLSIQPKIDLTTGKMNSAEALVRWNRNNPYNLQPDEFIPILESTLMIHDIGKWCIEEACRICKGWHDDGFTDMSISVNVSSVQFMRSNFISLVANALETSGLPAQCLEIELTEHVLMQDNKTVKSQLKSLKNLGIKLSIDDFGTGYSNLSYLINFKVDTIKLDRSFIAQVNTSSDHLAVVKAVIQMAQILNLRVVAEGVESEDVKQILVDLQCDYAQGYLWSKPLSVPEFTKELRQFNGNHDPQLHQAALPA